MKYLLLAAILGAAFLVADAAAQDKSAAPDWITTSNQACKLWNPDPQPNESVTWSGECEGGYASGSGTAQWTENGKPDAKYDGGYARGKRNGQGIITLPNGQRIVGLWYDDELTGANGNAI